jgi:hypothetical protein
MFVAGLVYCRAYKKKSKICMKNSKKIGTVPARGSVGISKFSLGNNPLRPRPPTVGTLYCYNQAFAVAKKLEDP